MSDHKIIKLKMATNIEKGNGIWIFNNTHLQDPSYCNGITEIAENFVFDEQVYSDYRHFWDTKKQYFINFSQNFSIEKCN